MSVLVSTSNNEFDNTSPSYWSEFKPDEYIEGLLRMCYE